MSLSSEPHAGEAGSTPEMHVEPSSVVTRIYMCTLKVYRDMLVQTHAFVHAYLHTTEPQGAKPGLNPKGRDLGNGCCMVCGRNGSHGREALVLFQGAIEWCLTPRLR